MQRPLAYTTFGLALVLGLVGCSDASTDDTNSSTGTGDQENGTSVDTVSTAATEGQNTGASSGEDEGPTGGGPGTSGTSTGIDGTDDTTSGAETTNESGDSTGAPVKDGPVHVVVLGSSTACGKNLDEPQYGGMVGGLDSTWANLYDGRLMSERPGSMVTNLCQSGYNTYHAMPDGTVNPPGLPDVDPAKNITAALALQPDAVIVSFPAVDETSNIPEILSNIATIAATAAAEDVPVWVSTPQPVEDMPPALLANKLQLRDDILAVYGDHALNFWSALATAGDTWDPAKMLTDGDHPNAVGHMALFDTVVAADIPTAALGL